MKRTARIMRFTAAMTLLVAALGCGLLEEATTFTVDTGWRKVTVDTASLGISIPSGPAIPAIPCQKSNDICAQATSQLSCKSTTYSCKVQCGAQDSCEIVADITESFTVDLADKIKNQTSATALSKVSLLRMVYNTLENTLTFDTPKIEVFVGPNTANKVTDPLVVRLATMPVIPKGQKPNAQLQDISEAGKQSLSNFVMNYQVPFKFFVKATARFASGDPLPKGRISLNLKAYFEVTPL